jgi:ADP-heptose:LPS heptosyltransferase
MNNQKEMSPKTTRCAQKRLHNQIQAIILQFTEALKDFTDTVALMKLVDIVITVDTSVAHLAGAIGNLVWILLPFNPDSRWLPEREDSPWHPTARLFRQPAIGDLERVSSVSVCNLSISLQTLAYL